MVTRSIRRLFIFVLVTNVDGLALTNPASRAFARRIRLKRQGEVQYVALAAILDSPGTKAKALRLAASTIVATAVR
jgi:hypothetical protein